MKKDLLETFKLGLFDLSLNLFSIKKNDHKAKKLTKQQYSFSSLPTIDWEDDEASESINKPASDTSIETSSQMNSDFSEAKSPMNNDMVQPEQNAEATKITKNVPSPTSKEKSETLKSLEKENQQLVAEMECLYYFWHCTLDENKKLEKQLEFAKSLNPSSSRNKESDDQPYKYFNI